MADAARFPGAAPGPHETPQEPEPMSAAAAATAAVDVPARKPGKKKLIVLLAVVVLVLAAAGVGGLLYLKKHKAAAEAAAAADDGGAPAAAAADAKPEHKVDKKHPPVFVPMDNFVVNLADHEADRYAQVGVVLEVPDEHAGEDIKTYLPAIRNNILLLLAHKASADLAGSEGKELLAREIRREALRAMGDDVEDDEPVAASASAPKAKAKKKKPAEDGPEPPIRSVQFSSFIIQ
jgi:flagellar FliL protein